ncbi:hypothetical protein BJ170DRAFT_717797 [Xylariales sp. AK1849]|nr:hypothetical protein BJ170DRAFT_717797 [Xylariales sp. AK1849]
MALNALDTAEEGVKLHLPNSFNHFNSSTKTRPGILETLAGDWALDTLRDYNDEKAIFRFSRYAFTGLEGSERKSSLPVPTQVQVDALDAIQFLAASIAISIAQGKGDILFINDVA